MAMEEVKFGGDTKVFEKGVKVTGILQEVRTDIGDFNSTIYVIDGNQYWGAGALDPLMKSAIIGKAVEIECDDDQYKFPNGRVGKHFVVKVDR